MLPFTERVLVDRSRIIPVVLDRSLDILMDFLPTSASSSRFTTTRSKPARLTGFSSNTRSPYSPDTAIASKISFTNLERHSGGCPQHPVNAPCSSTNLRLPDSPFSLNTLRGWLLFGRQCGPFPCPILLILGRWAECDPPCLFWTKN